VLDEASLAGWIGRWPAGHAAVAVVGVDGSVRRAGDLDREFRLASVSKPLTALAILVAVEEETVGLDDPAGPPGSTLRHLLAHASGLAFEGDRVLAAPGTRRIYSNTGVEVAAAHLEAAAGVPFAAYQREAVFDRLGMAGTELRGSPASGVVSVVGDLARVAHELLAPTLVHSSTMAEARSPVFPDLAGVLPELGRFDPNPWGLGFEVRGHKQPHWTGTRNSPATFGHFGGSGTFLWVDPVAGLACIGLTDRAFGRWAIEAWPVFSDAVLGSLSQDGG
jgi:CubicO group peptidase (beta-lactamase class C family)